MIFEKQFITIDTAQKIGFVAHLISVKGKIKYANNFDFVFDTRQR